MNSLAIIRWNTRFSIDSAAEIGFSWLEIPKFY